MRVLGGLGLVAIIVAAFTVPLPWVAHSPSRVVEVADAVTVTFLPPARGAPAVPSPPPLSGTFLATHLQGGRSLAAVLSAVVAPGRIVDSAAAEPSDVLAQPGTIAALRGLGLSPVRMAGAPLPVEVEVGDDVDPASLATWLYVFDTTSQLDVAQGRTVAAVGRVGLDESLECIPGAAEAVTAARQAGAQVIVVPAACAGIPRDDRVVAVQTFIQAVDAAGLR